MSKFLPKRYRKKPVVVETMVFDGTMEVTLSIVQWLSKHGYHADPVISFDNPDEAMRLVIETLEGDMYASPGDYIIKGVQDEFYPCKPDIFLETYEKVES